LNLCLGWKNRLAQSAGVTYFQVEIKRISNLNPCCIHMNEKKVLAAATALVLSGLLGACGPNNTLAVHNNSGSTDFRLKALESSLQKTQEELKALAGKQHQDDARQAEIQKKLSEIAAALQIPQQQRGGKKATPQASALGVGFARPGAASADALVDPGQPTPAGSPDKAAEPGAQAPVAPPADSQVPGTPSPTPPGASAPATVGAAPTGALAAAGSTAAASPSQPTPAPAVVPPKEPVPPASIEGRSRKGSRVGPPDAESSAERTEAASSPTSKAPLGKAVSPVPGSVENAPTAEKNEYNRALQMAINGRTVEAKAAFDQFLTAHPQSSLAPNALYWVGEGAFAAGDYKTAISDFEKVAKDWPGHAKAADSLYKMAVAQEKAGDMAGARASLERYLSGYPNADLAGVVRQKLQSLPQ